MAETHRHVNPWIVAIAVMFGTFMEVLDTTVVNVSLPHIAASMSASIDESTWVLTSYLVANAIVLPMTGWLASAFGRKRLLVADMESTLVENEFLDDIAAQIGIGPKIADITRRAMAGELDFDEALTERVRLLRGLDLAALDRVLRERISLTPGGLTLVATMKAHGAFTALVSGGFTQKKSVDVDITATAPKLPD